MPLEFLRYFSSEAIAARWNLWIFYINILWTTICPSFSRLRTAQIFEICINWLLILLFCSRLASFHEAFILNKTHLLWVYFTHIVLVFRLVIISTVYASKFNTIGNEKTTARRDTKTVSDLQDRFRSGDGVSLIRDNVNETSANTSAVHKYGTLWNLLLKIMNPRHAPIDSNQLYTRRGYCRGRRPCLSEIICRIP